MKYSGWILSVLVAPVLLLGGVTAFEKEKAVNPIRVQPLVLMYHDVVPSASELIYSADITREDFQIQLEYLKQNGYVGVSMDEMLAAKEGKVKLPARSVVITFDDGDAGSVDAAELLKKYDFKATYFVLTDYVGEKKGKIQADHATAKQLRKIIEDPRFKVYSHTASHPYLRQLAQEKGGAEEIRNELRGSCVALDIMLHEGIDDPLVAKSMALQKIREKKDSNIDCGHIAYPYGDVDGRTVLAVKKAGYRSGLAIDPESESGTPVFKIPRVPVGSQHFHSPEGFVEAIQKYRKRYQPGVLLQDSVIPDTVRCGKDKDYNERPGGVLVSRPTAHSTQPLLACFRAAYQLSTAENLADDPLHPGCVNAVEGGAEGFASERPLFVAVQAEQVVQGKKVSGLCIMTSKATNFYPVPSFGKDVPIRFVLPGHGGYMHCRYKDFPPGALQTKFQGQTLYRYLDCRRGSELVHPVPASLLKHERDLGRGISSQAERSCTSRFEDAVRNRLIRVKKKLAELNERSYRNVTAQALTEIQNAIDLAKENCSEETGLAELIGELKLGIPDESRAIGPVLKNKAAGAQ